MKPMLSDRKAAPARISAIIAENSSTAMGPVTKRGTLIPNMATDMLE